jgi:hypothetical protein
VIRELALQLASTSPNRARTSTGASEGRIERRRCTDAPADAIAWRRNYSVSFRPGLGYTIRVTAVLALPLPVEELPESLRRFGDPAAPERVRTIAARGLVPVKGGDLVALLLQLAADPIDAVASSAKATLDGLPPGVLEAASEAPLHPAFLDALADRLSGDEEGTERLLNNAHLADATIVRIARHGSQRVTERLALNEQKVLAAPEIIEALYKNRHTRMSTIDRLIELCVRNGVVVEGIPTFEAHAQAIAGQLIPEPSDEPLPSDTLFEEAVAADKDVDAIEVDPAEGTEKVKEDCRPLSIRLGDMSTAEKLRLTLIGNAAARALLVRDSNKQVAMAAVASPGTTESEASSMAHSRQVGEDVLRFIGNKREWLGNYELKKALVFNPKTPVGISMRFLGHLHVADLRGLSKSRGIPAALKSTAMQRITKKGG